MRKIYTAVSSIYNGTVTISNSVASFTSKELAEEACQRVELVNKEAYLKVHCKVHESELFEDREEVPVLNKPIEELKSNITAEEKWHERRKCIPEPIIATKTEE